MGDESPLIRRATPADTPMLGALARRVFVETFGDDPAHRPHDMSLFLATALSDEALRRELALPGTVYDVAEHRARLVGYLKTCIGEAPACVRGRRPLEVARLYVDFDWHGRGVAHRLMQRSIDRAAAEGCDVIWLGVWHRNVRAQRFYRKWGFEHVGEHPFLFGTDLQADLVFARPWPGGSAVPAESRTV